VGPPDSPVVHRTVTVLCPVRLLAPALTLRALSTHCSLLQTTVGADSRCSVWHTGQSGATPDSPVNYSGVAPQIPEAEQFRVDPPWCTGHCPVRQTRAAFGFLCSFDLNPFFYLCIGLL
jgi:hypothetical protein